MDRTITPMHILSFPFNTQFNGVLRRGNSEGINTIIHVDIFHHICTMTWNNFNQDEFLKKTL
jgi:hypothetical protein